LDGEGLVLVVAYGVWKVGSDWNFRVLFEAMKGVLMEFGETTLI
jgi:hypothetical protein